MTYENFEEMDVWKTSRLFVREIYNISSNTKFNKDFALKNQIRAASVSVLSNISEGYERKSVKEFVQFISISKGSVGEVRAQLYIALDLGYINNDEFINLSDKAKYISKSLSGLIKYLQNK